MPTGDPLAASQATKETAAVLREARSLLRRADKMAFAVDAAEDPVATRLAAEARGAIEQLVRHLSRLEQQQQRQAHRLLRRPR